MPAVVVSKTANGNHGREEHHRFVTEQFAYRPYSMTGTFRLTKQTINLGPGIPILALYRPTQYPDEPLSKSVKPSVLAPNLR
jgi:hypothetical protein